MEQACLDNTRRLNALEKSVAEETAYNEAEHESFKRRISALEEGGKTQYDILVTLQKQADNIETMNEKIDTVATSVEHVAERVSDIEKEPADKWKKVTFEVIKCVVLAVAGIAIGVIFKTV